MKTTVTMHSRNRVTFLRITTENKETRLRFSSRSEALGYLADHYVTADENYNEDGFNWHYNTDTDILSCEVVPV